MAGQTTGLQKTFKIEDVAGIAMYTGVTFGATEGYVKVATENSIPVGIVTNDERLSTALSAGGSQAGKNIAVQLDDIGDIKLSGNVAYGDKVIFDANGKAKKLPTADGTYNVVGFALKGGVADDVVPVRIDYHVVVLKA